jgi:hypothetical protein
MSRTARTGMTSASITPPDSKKWWQGLFAPKRPPTPFDVACPCGHILHGIRRRRHQVLTCNQCQNQVFIYPQSPWSSAAFDPLAEPAATSSRARRFWLRFGMPLLAGAVTAALLIAVFVAVMPYLSRPVANSQPPSQPASVQLQEHIAEGQRALAAGNFNLALGEFNAALDLRDRQPDLLASKQQRDLIQLQRQSDLLARLHNQPLQELLKEALLTPRAEEWTLRFETVHKGRSVLLDDVVRRDAASGRLVLACYELRAGDEKAFVYLDDLKILQMMPLEPRRRLIFGGRLKSAAREERGAWVFHFEPESGVLLTDADAAAACWPTPLDAEAIRTLQRQAEWLQELPAQHPAP